MEEGGTECGRKESEEEKESAQYVLNPRIAPSAGVH